ncbi:hypothetical protein TNCV_1882231 [Trichonephila clavipes]|nr:hypothetical protein TNCV_1882231 [Trichonephila clavipes]
MIRDFRSSTAAISVSYTSDFGCPQKTKFKGLRFGESGAQQQVHCDQSTFRDTWYGGDYAPQSKHVSCTNHTSWYTVAATLILPQMRGKFQ